MDACVHRYLKLLIALAAVAGGEAVAALPKDPCALLTPAEIQVLAPNAKIGNGKPDTSAAPMGVACSYSWGPRTNEWGESALSITVIDGTKAWPGTTPDTLAEGLRAKVGAPRSNATQVSGVGDAAVFSHEARSNNGTVEAYFKKKNLHLSVVFHSGESLASKDKLVALLKQAAARL